jgi:hypothetical protein
MSSWKWFLLSFFGAGTFFWISDVMMPLFDPNEQRGRVTIVCPFVLILFYAAVFRLRKAQRLGPSTAIFAICGMWVLAIPFTLLAQTARSHGGMGFGWDEIGYVLVSSFLPTRIVEFVTLEGSIIALWVGTAAMIICHLAFERGRWIVPPSLWAAFHRRTSE